MTTLAEARQALWSALGSGGYFYAGADQLIDALLAAHLRALAGTPDSATMERAMNAFREAATVEMQLGKRLDRQEEAGLHAAYPLLVAPLRAEVERLKAATLLDLMPPGYELVSVDVREQLAIVSDDLATAEARINEFNPVLAAMEARALSAELRAHTLTESWVEETRLRVAAEQRVRETRKATLEEVRDLLDKDERPPLTQQALAASRGELRDWLDAQLQETP